MQLTTHDQEQLCVIFGVLRAQAVRVAVLGFSKDVAGGPPPTTSCFGHGRCDPADIPHTPAALTACLTHYRSGCCYMVTRRHVGHFSATEISCLCTVSLSWPTKNKSTADCQPSADGYAELITIARSVGPSACWVSYALRMTTT